jgi:sec-independent protein translocase protein TatB
MDILGIGFPELIFIMIIAMMIFGPRRLPEMAAKAGKFVADLRNMSQGLMAEWQREITVAARLEEIEKARQELKEIEQELKQIPKDVTKETAAAKAALEEKTIAPPRPASPPASSPSSSPQPEVAETVQPTAEQPPDPEPVEEADVLPAPQSVENRPEMRNENGTVKSTEEKPVETAPEAGPPPEAKDESASYSKPKEVVNE